MLTVKIDLLIKILFQLPLLMVFLALFAIVSKLSTSVSSLGDYYMILVICLAFSSSVRTSPGIFWKAYVNHYCFYGNGNFMAISANTSTYLSTILFEGALRITDMYLSTMAYPFCKK